MTNQPAKWEALPPVNNGDGTITYSRRKRATAERVTAYDGIAWDRDGREYGFDMGTRKYYPKDGGEPLTWDEFHLIESPKPWIGPVRREEK